MKIAGSEPQEAYVVFVKGFKSKFTYFMRTISGFGPYKEPIEQVITNELIPAFFGDDVSPDANTRELLSLPLARGGLGLYIPCQEANQQYIAPRRITEIHAHIIKNQDGILRARSERNQSSKEIKTEVVREIREKIQEKEQSIFESLDPERERLMKQSQDKGASSWLSCLPLPHRVF